MDKPTKRGLKRDLHSILRSDNVNLLKIQGKYGSNPYLLHQGNEAPSHKRISSHWYRPGEVIENSKRIRAIERERQKEEEQAKIDSLKLESEVKRKILIGELPADNEKNYLEKIEDVPDLEWWDADYYANGTIHDKYFQDYSQLDDDEDSDDEEEMDLPSIRYIQHPVPIKNINDIKFESRVYLTRDEQKKARRNNRKLLRKEKEQKIKLGLEPKPETKVKLSNMMSVYENNANITDPTKWEAIVRAQVAERKRKHILTNAQRHEESVARKKLAQEEKDNVKPKDNCCVYIFNEIKNPSIRYKINMNGKQLHLRGCCLHVNEGKGIIITFGDEKSVRFFDKLVVKRLKWDEPYKDKKTGEIVPCSGKVTKVWQGIMGEYRFKGWFMLNCSSNEELLKILREQDALELLPAGSLT